MTKAEIIAELEAAGIDHDPKATKADLVDLLDGPPAGHIVPVRVCKDGRRVHPGTGMCQTAMNAGDCDCKAAK